MNEPRGIHPLLGCALWLVLIGAISVAVVMAFVLSTA